MKTLQNMNLYVKKLVSVGLKAHRHFHTQTHANKHTHINPKQIVQIGKKCAYWIKQWLISLQDCSEYSVLISIQLHVLWQQRNFYICFFTRTRCHTHKQPENMQKTATDESKQRNKINWREDSDNGICIRIYYKNNETHTDKHSHRIMHECSKVNNSTEHTKNAALKRNLDSHVISYLLSSLFQFYSHLFMCFLFCLWLCKIWSKKNCARIHGARIQKHCSQSEMKQTQLAV